MKDILSSPELLDELYGSDPEITGQIDHWHQLRKAAIEDTRVLKAPMSIVSESNTDEYDIYEKIADRERKLVAPNLSIADYANGTASFDDQIAIEEYGNEIFISADHATDPVRKATGVREGADHGTAGLGSVVAEEANGTIVLPIGRQTSNANVALDHPLKNVLKNSIQDTGGFLSLHGMALGKVMHQFDQSEIHGVLGMGNDPGEESLDLANDMVRKIQEDLGLRFVVGNTSVFYPYDENNAPRLSRDIQGNLKTSSLAAKGEGTTTNFVRRQNESIAAMQLELSRSIRFLPEGKEYRDIKAARYGVYLGYLALKELCIMMKQS